MLPLTTYLGTGSKSNGEALEIVLLRYFRFYRLTERAVYSTANRRKNRLPK